MLGTARVVLVVAKVEKVQREGSVPLLGTPPFVCSIMPTCFDANDKGEGAIVEAEGARCKGKPGWANGVLRSEKDLAVLREATV